MDKVFILWRYGYDLERIIGVYIDPDYAEECLDAFMEADKEQEYTWMMNTYSIQQRPNTEK